jgi:integrase
VRNAKPVRIVKVDEVVELLNIAKDLRYKTAISLAYYHGLRRKEICNLTWQDVDFNQERLNILDRPKGRTKTRLSRSIALRRETADLLN